MEVIERNELMTWNEFAEANKYKPDGILYLFLPTEIEYEDGQKMNCIAYLKKDGKVVPVWAYYKGSDKDVIIAEPIK